MADNYCWSHGPRIGDEGRPVCFRERGHKGMHESHPGSGFVDVIWSGPAMEVPEAVRGKYWTPDSVATTDPAVEAAERQMEKQFGRPWSGPSYQLRVRTEAAREALAPVRELHQACVDYHRPHAEAGDSFSAGVMHAMRDLAYLIYTSEELSDGE